MQLRRAGPRADELLAHLDDRLRERYGEAFVGVREAEVQGVVDVDFAAGADPGDVERRVREMLAEVAPDWDVHVEVQ